MPTSMMWETANTDAPDSAAPALNDRNEPWIVGDRLLLPWHDPRYRGYGRDKVRGQLAARSTPILCGAPGTDACCCLSCAVWLQVQFVADVHAKGFVFKVLHNAFAIHRCVFRGRGKGGEGGRAVCSVQVERDCPTTTFAGSIAHQRPKQATCVVIPGSLTGLIPSQTTWCARVVTVTCS